jgi:hypothetical protein
MHLFVGSSLLFSFGSDPEVMISCTVSFPSVSQSMTSKSLSHTNGSKWNTVTADSITSPHIFFWLGVVVVVDVWMDRDGKGRKNEEEEKSWGKSWKNTKMTNGCMQ